MTVPRITPATAAPKIKYVEIVFWRTLLYYEISNSPSDRKLLSLSVDISFVDGETTASNLNFCLVSYSANEFKCSK